MSHTSMLLLLAINIPMAIGVGHLFFKNWQEFLTGLALLIKNRKVLFFDRNDLSECLDEIKVCVYLLSCLVLFCCEYYLFTNFC